MDTKQKIGIMRDLFVNRDDVYGQQYKSNNGCFYKFIKSQLSDEIIKQHIQGLITIGFYPGYDSTTKWVCIDIDSTTVDDVENVWKKAEENSIPCYFEVSGNKGYHCWIFFDKPIENKKAKALGKFLAPKWEIFPKQ